MNAAIANLRQDPDASGTVSGSIAVSGLSHRYCASIENSLPDVTITSTGKAAGFTRTVRARLVVVEKPFKGNYPVRIVWWREVAGVNLIP